MKVSAAIEYFRRTNCTAPAAGSNYGAVRVMSELLGVKTTTIYASANNVDGMLTERLAARLYAITKGELRIDPAATYGQYYKNLQDKE